MNERTDAESYKSLFKYLNGQMVGQAVGHHLMAPEDKWEGLVTDQCMAMFAQMMEVCRPECNMAVRGYAGKHLALMLEKAPEMRQQIKDHLAKIGALPTDFKEALNMGVDLIKKREGGA